ncbi:GxxExxY protein [Geothrix sp. 21YS21S-2]|uniref:GxxExxY protein n=1 Tax=Geothrix sp. 21YS21S-2 TaxID=3068893 RepID=UPI0027B93AF9|nr:GxxExxY protein [Geothrix sp. 21YS21S-2]
MVERTPDPKGEVMGRHWGEDWGDNHPHRDITEAIILAAIRVQIVLGPGLLENACKACLAHELRLAGHQALREVHLDITYKGLCVENAYIMDLVADHKGVIEAKAIATFSDADFAQLNSCLHFANSKAGLLIHFHNWPLKDGGIKRLVNTKP